MSESTPILDYGRPPSPGRRWLKPLVWCVTILAMAWGAWSLWAWYEPQYSAYKDQCAIEASIAAPGDVLYSEDPGDVARLVGQPHYEASHSQNEPPRPAVERVSESYSNPGGHGRFRSGMPPIGLRRVPGGPWRLINVGGGQYGSQPDGSRNAMFPVFDVCTRITLERGSRSTQLWYGINRLIIDRTDNMTILAGHLDPVDESHFTFDYKLNGQPGTVDGYLAADDSVKFNIRSGPATTRPFKHGGARQNFP
jgi:hypothetical protein